MSINMDTRTEEINGTIYCAYCGKVLRKNNYNNNLTGWACCDSAYHPTYLTCDCEKAKEELNLYQQLKDLYNLTLSENLIDIKVKLYKNKLLGIKEPIDITAYSSVKINSMPVDSADTTVSTISNPQDARISLTGQANDNVIMGLNTTTKKLPTKTEYNLK